MNIFKIVLPGDNVKDVQLADEVVDSRFSSPKVDTIADPPHAGIIFLNWQSSIAVAEGTTKLIYSFPHNYGYIPSVFGSHTFDNGSRKTRGVLPFQVGGLGILLLDTDNTNVNLKYFSTDLTSSTIIPPFIMQIRYYVMAERGHE